MAFPLPDLIPLQFIIDSYITRLLERRVCITTAKLVSGVVNSNRYPRSRVTWSIKLDFRIIKLYCQSILGFNSTRFLYNRVTKNSIYINSSTVKLCHLPPPSGTTNHLPCMNCGVPFWMSEQSLRVLCDFVIASTASFKFNWPASPSVVIVCCPHLLRSVNITPDR